MFQTQANVDSSPAVDANGNIYIGSDDGNLYALASNGALRWSFNFGAPVCSSPALMDSGDLYVAPSGGPMCCFSGVAAPPGAPTVTDNGPYTTQPVLQASWSSPDPAFDVDYFQYAVGTSAGAADVVPFTTAGTSRKITLTGLPLVNGRQYFFAVRETNEAGITGAAGVSDGVILDTTPPAVPVVIDNGPQTAQPLLQATWSSSDPESGISSYAYAVGTSPGGTDVVPFTNVGTATQVSLSGLPLVNGVEYFFAVVATDGAGLSSRVGVSGGVRYSPIAPSAPVVTDYGPYTSQPILHATWTSSDPASNISFYEYAIGTSAGGADIVGFTNAGTNTEVTLTGLPLTNGTTYYFAVRATSPAGLKGSAGVSNGIMLDATPPSTPVVTDGGAYASQAVLQAEWSSSDPESGIAYYEYAVGTSPGASDIVPFTKSTSTQVTLSGLPLVSGAAYYFAVTATNNAGLTSAVGLSSSIIVDTAPPSAPVVTGGGGYISQPILQASWTSADPAWNISFYEYAVGTSPGGTDVVGFTNAGTSTQVTLAGLPLTNGMTHYFAVRATNLAGVTGVCRRIQRCRSRRDPAFRPDYNHPGSVYPLYGPSELLMLLSRPGVRHRPLLLLGRKRPGPCGRRGLATGEESRLAYNFRIEPF